MTIAGSDPGGGAGFQADLKTFAAFGVHGYSVITAVIAQNSARVEHVHALEAGQVTEQIQALLRERRPEALKTGALASASTVRAVAEAVREFKLPLLVVDPVLVSSSGSRLLDAAGEKSLKERLLPLARVVTPNIPEAETLTGLAIDGMAGMRQAARMLRSQTGARAVVIKGGHGHGARARPGDAGPRPRAVSNCVGAAVEQRVIDLLFDGRAFITFSAVRVAGGGAHGTGCAFSAAIAACLARGEGLEAAVRHAKAFVTRALQHSYLLGAGRPLLDHLAGLSRAPRR